MSNHVKKIGFFGGTFDPIHFGHINVALAIKEHFSLDLVLFSATPCNPFKLQNPPIVPLKERIKMVDKAVKSIKDFTTVDVEAQYEQMSFTVDALKAVQKIYFDCKLFLILTDEMLKNFENWKNSDEILQIVDILVGSRLSDLKKCDLNGKIPKKNIIKTPIFEISATYVRHRLKNNLYCAHLLPEIVIKYIKENGFYQS